MPTVATAPPPTASSLSYPVKIVKLKPAKTALRNRYVAFSLALVVAPPMIVVSIYQTRSRLASHKPMSQEVPFGGTLTGLLDYSAATNGSAPGILCDDSSISFASLADASRRITTALAGTGIRSGDT
jgi:hypothetical protein